MATVRIPIDLRNPRMTSLAGNSFFTVVGLTAWDAGHWQFINAVDGKIYGIVPIPNNVAVTPNAAVILSLAANATIGNTVLQVLTKAVIPAGSFNPASLTAETSQTITVPATARLRFNVTFPSAGNLAEVVAANDVLIVEVFRNGANAADTLAVNLELYEAFLRIDVV